MFIIACMTRHAYALALMRCADDMMYEVQMYCRHVESDTFRVVCMYMCHDLV